MQEKGQFQGESTSYQLEPSRLSNIEHTFNQLSYVNMHVHKHYAALPHVALHLM